MSGRLEGKVAIVVGAGQTPGDTIGNGRATALLYAREGAKVVAADIRLDSAEETVEMIRKEGGSASGQEILDFEHEILNPIERPSEVEIRDELPKTMIGKLSKKELVSEHKEKEAQT